MTSAGRTVLVVGGGVAGVAMARRLADHGVAVTILEAGPELGGTCASIRMSGWRFDLGLHCFFTTLPAVADEVDAYMGAAHRARPVREMLRDGGEWRPYPPLRNLARYPGAPADTGSEPDGTERNAAELARRLVGAALADRFVLPHLRKHWGAEPEELPAAMARRGVVPAAEEIDRGRYAALDAPPTRTWHYPVTGGFAEYIRHLAGDLPVRLDARVVRIDTDRREAMLADGDVIGYDHLVSSIPLPDLYSMLSPSVPAMAHRAAALRHSSVTLVSLGVSAATPPAPWVYSFDPAVPWERAVFPAEWDPAAAPPGTAGAQVEIYGSGAPPDAGSLPRSVAESLRDLGLLPADAKVLASDVRTLTYANTFAGKDDVAFVAEATAQLDGLGISTVGRFGRWDNARFDQVLARTWEAAGTLLRAWSPTGVTQ